MSKIQTFLSDPARSVISKLSPVLAPLEQSWAQWNLNRRISLDFLSKRPDQSIPPDFGDLWFLYREAFTRKPETIWEFGSGCSTAVLAQAVLDAGRPGARMISIETDPYWARMSANLLSDETRKICEIRHLTAEETELHGRRVFRYKNLPEGAPEFMYLDGPPLNERVNAAADLLFLEVNLPAGFFMVVDGRLKNVEFLKAHLKRRYRVQSRFLANRTTRTTFELLS